MKTTSKKLTFKKDNPERLDVFLAEKQKVTRSQAQKLMDQKNISINDKPAQKGGLILKNGDIIKIEDKKDEVKKETITKENPIVKTEKIKIIEVADDYIVIEKPSGLLTHPTDKNEPDSVASQLVKKYPELKKIGEDKKRPGIVHRLDKEASGLMVVARTQKMFEFLKEQFKNRQVEKEYLALAHGQIKKDWDEIRFNLERSKNNDRISALPNTVKGEPNPIGKEALTEFWVEKRFVNFTLVKVKIHTGRMHQIRAHFLAYDHPLVSDPLYYQKKRRDKWDKVCGRLFLHSCHLGFTDLEGKPVEFNSKLPEKLENFLKLLK